MQWRVADVAHRMHVRAATVDQQSHRRGAACKGGCVEHRGAIVVSGIDLVTVALDEACELREIVVEICGNRRMSQTRRPQEQTHGDTQADKQAWARKQLVNTINRQWSTAPN